MAFTEQTILRAVTVRPDIGAIEVEWRNQVLRDGVVIADTPHRKAYMSDQKDEFLVEVEGAPDYVAAAGWV